MKRKTRGAFVCAECKTALPHPKTEIVKVNGCQVLVHVGKCLKGFKARMEEQGGTLTRMDKLLSQLDLPDGMKFPESPGAIRKSQYREGGERIGAAKRHGSHKRRIGTASPVRDKGVA
jgi:hypothetical protein